MSATDPAGSRPPRHENRDINVRAVMGLGLLLLVGTVASMGLMKWMFDSLDSRENRIQLAPASEISTQGPATAADQPRFVMFPARNLREFRQAEESYLTSYGWVDREGGVARIPVDRAMDLLVESGLPPVPPKPPAGETAP